MPIVGAWLALALLSQSTAQLTPPGLQQSQQRPWSFSGATTKAEAMRLAQQDDLLQRISNNLVGGLTTGATGLDLEVQQQFQDWAAYFGYTFLDPRQRSQAYSNWVNNTRLVWRLNTDESLPYWAGENQFSHLTAQQYQNRGLMRTASTSQPAGLQSPVYASPRTSALPPSGRRRLSQQSSLPDEVDWQGAGKVTPIKNQYTAGLDLLSNPGCGSCWAFTAVAAIESAYLIAHNLTVQDMPYLDLSEEQLLECCNSTYSPDACPTSQACEGGATWEGASYAFDNLLRMEQVYPYASGALPLGSGSAGQCLIPQRPPRGIQLSRPPELQRIPSNKDAIKQALTVGPVMANVDASAGEASPP